MLDVAFLIWMFLTIECLIVFHFSYGDQVSVHESDVRLIASGRHRRFGVIQPFTSGFSLVLVDLALILCDR